VTDGTRTVDRANAAAVSCPCCKAIIPLPPLGVAQSDQAFLVTACNAGDDDQHFRQVADNDEHVLEIMRSLLGRFDYLHVDDLRELDTSYLDPISQEQAA
jgi:hypothetical protein